MVRFAIHLCSEAVSPSTGLRKWYRHDPARFEKFTRRYRNEREDPSGQRPFNNSGAIEHRLAVLAATKDLDISQVVVLCDLAAPVTNVGDVSRKTDSSKQADR